MNKIDFQLKVLSGFRKILPHSSFELNTLNIYDKFLNIIYSTNDEIFDTQFILSSKFDPKQIKVSPKDKNYIEKVYVVKYINSDDVYSYLYVRVDRNSFEHFDVEFKIFLNTFKISNESVLSISNDIYNSLILSQDFYAKEKETLIKENSKQHSLQNNSNNFKNSSIFQKRENEFFKRNTNSVMSKFSKYFENFDKEKSFFYLAVSRVDNCKLTTNDFEILRLIFQNSKTIVDLQKKFVIFCFSDYSIEKVDVRSLVDNEFSFYYYSTFKEECKSDLLTFFNAFMKLKYLSEDYSHDFKDYKLEVNTMTDFMNNPLLYKKDLYKLISIRNNLDYIYTFISDIIHSDKYSEILLNEFEVNFSTELSRNGIFKRKNKLEKIFDLDLDKFEDCVYLFKIIIIFLNLK